MKTSVTDNHQGRQAQVLVKTAGEEEREEQEEDEEYDPHKRVLTSTSISYSLVRYHWPVGSN